MKRRITRINGTATVRQKTALIYVDCDCNFDGIKIAADNI